MYEIFEKLCKEKGVTAYKVGKDTHIYTSTFTDWKNGKSKPKQDKLKRIADYFGVSVDYLIDGKEKEYEVPTYSSEYFELISLYSQLDIDTQNKMLENMRKLVEAQKILKGE